MPIYEYRCSACGHELELMMKLNDPAPDPCPKCGAEKTVERLMSRTSFQLKGGGWYSDLYGSSKPAPKEGAKDGGKEGGTSGAEAKAKAEPAKKESTAKDAGSASPSPAPSTPSSEGAKK